MIRTFYLCLLAQYLRTFSICVILGIDQSGKTDLAYTYIEKHHTDKVIFFNLNNRNDYISLQNHLESLDQHNDYLIIIDEIQRKPKLLEYVQTLVNDATKKYKFLILADTIENFTAINLELLDGKIGYIELAPFNFSEIDDVEKLFLRGGFPRSYLAKSDEQSIRWRNGYIRSFTEEIILNFGFRISSDTMYHFLLHLSSYQGKNFNASEIARRISVSQKTATAYLQALEAALIIRVLQPWYEDIEKRQVKTPKIYFRDSGIFNTLLSINSIQELSSNPKIGQLWESFALEQVIIYFQFPSKTCYFWSTSNNAELDLLVFHNEKRIGFQFTYSDSPKTTKSMHIALQDLKLDQLYVIYPGTKKFEMTEKITACGLVTLKTIKL